MSRLVTTSTVPLAVVDEGDGPPVMLLHGFPESSYSWRLQIPALVAAGFRVVAPDQRGYGASAHPEAIGAYALTHLVDDVVALADALDLDRFALVGHDWGAIVAQTTAVRHPDRVERLANLNVPYTGWCPGFPSLDVLRSLGDRFAYVLSFQEPGEAEARFSADPDGWLWAIYRGVAHRPGFLAEDDFRVYRDAFVAGGIAGPLNWYRNIDRNAVDLGHLAGRPITAPTLMITVGHDPVVPARAAEAMSGFVPHLTRVHIEESGHWTQQEQPEAVNEALLSFLSHP